MNKKNAFFMIAFRNVTRNSKSNRFVIASIALGLASLFWIKCIFIGHNDNMINVATSTFIGGVQIHSREFLQSKSISHHFAYAPVEETLKKTPGIHWAKRIFFPALLSTSSDSSLGIIYGIEPESESQVTELKKNLKQGNYLSPEPNQSCTQKEIYLSERLASKLNVGLQDKIVVMGQAIDGTTGNDLFRVAGLYNSGSSDFDETHSFINFQCAQEIASLPNQTHEIVLKSDEIPDQQQQLYLQNQFSANHELDHLEVTTWREFIPNLATMVRMNTGVTNMITLVFFLITTLGVVNSMLMSVFERTKEFGILLALGVTPNQIKRVILYESFILAVFSGIIGAIIGFTLVSYHHHYGMDITPFIGKAKNSFVGFRFQTMVYPKLDWKLYFMFFSVEVLFILAAGFYPAMKAARLNPIESIRS